MKKIFGALCFIAILVLTYFFWPGAAPSLPQADEVLEIQLVQDQEEVKIDQTDAIKKLVTELGKSNKIRQESIHDTPPISPHVQITFVMTDGKAIAYAYKGKYGVTYLEQPYVGIYQLQKAPQLIQHLLAD